MSAAPASNPQTEADKSQNPSSEADELTIYVSPHVYRDEHDSFYSFKTTYTGKQSDLYRSHASLAELHSFMKVESEMNSKDDDDQPRTDESYDARCKQSFEEKCATGGKPFGLNVQYVDRQAQESSDRRGVPYEVLCNRIVKNHPPPRTEEMQPSDYAGINALRSEYSSGDEAGDGSPPPHTPRS